MSFKCWSCFFPGMHQNTPPAYQKKKCAICVGIDNIHELRNCTYCHACKEWMCDACKPRMYDRGWLALKKLFRFN